MSVIENIEIRVRGTVQGVGFRPTVWRLAHDNDLVGEVHNDTDGVLIKLSGAKTKLSNFLTNLTEQAPPLSKIDSVEVQPGQPNWNFSCFSIGISDTVSGLTEVTPDAATCPECLKEMLTPNERRYQYPFTNCTHCGPRLSIVQGIPYDRGLTTMANFPMCSQCSEEYRNPADRRFHAQPIACHKCGPRVYVAAPNFPDFDPPVTHDNSKRCDDTKLSADKMAQVQRCLNEGKIVAIRGIGGFHLSCDATNTDAVARLRERKQRYAKPFALMTHDISTSDHYCHLSDIERQHLL
ncbi:MAG: hydrogenase maturation protein HypF, partial [Alteromonadaceae bacterium]